MKGLDILMKWGKKLAGSVVPSNESAQTPENKSKKEWRATVKKERTYRWYTSFMGKMIAVLLLVLLVPSGLIGVISYNSAKDEVEKQIQVGVNSSMQIAQQSMNLLFSSVVRELDQTSYTLAGSGAAPIATVQSRLDHLIETVPYLDSVVFIQPNGSVLSAPVAEGGAAASLDQEIGQNEAPGAENVRISTPATSSLTGNQVVAFTLPIEGGGSLTFNLGTAKLAEQISTFTIGGSGSLLILTPEREVVAGAGNLYVYGFDLGFPFQDIQSIPDGFSPAQPGDFYASKMQTDITGEMIYLNVLSATDPITGWEVSGLVGAEDYVDAVQPILTTSSITTAVSILAALLLIVYLGRTFNIPMKILQSGIKTIRDGDLTSRVAYKKKDEFAQLASEFNYMTVSLQNMVTAVKSSSEMLSASSDLIQKSTQETTESVNHVSGIVQENAEYAVSGAEASRQAADTIDEMARGIVSVAETAGTIVDAAHSTSEKVGVGSGHIQEVSQQMNRILSAVDDSSHMMNELSALSDEAGKMTAAISDISKQTNLLSLNAAIEASRAGENGRGFAVVADEVRKLSEQSNQTASQIGGTLTRMIELIQRTNEAMQGNVREQLNQGLSVTADAASAFSGIEESTSAINGMIQDISASAEELSASTEEVSATVYELSNISKRTADSAQSTSASTQQQTAMMTEINHSAHELANISDSMQELIRKFKV